jgi:hypothetical protein
MHTTWIVIKSAVIHIDISRLVPRRPNSRGQILAVNADSLHSALSMEAFEGKKADKSKSDKV